MDTEFIESEQTSIDFIKNPDAIFQRERAAVDMQIVTAKQYPRNLRRAVDNAIATVQLSQEIAESCTYALPRAGKPLTGPSVHLAKIIAQLWGNMRVQSRVINMELKYVTCEGVCWDLESNLAAQCQIKRLILKRDGTRFSEDMVAVTGNAGNSIALRNAIFSVIPKPVIDKVHDAAQRFVVGKIKTEEQLISKRKELLDGYRDIYGVTEAEVLKFLGKTAVENIGIEECHTLIKYKTALRESELSVEDVFRPKKDQFVVATDKLEQRILVLIGEAKDINTLEKYKPRTTSTRLMEAYDKKYAELIKK